MHIIVVGVDHTTAPIALRERLACPARYIPQQLQEARKVSTESVLLSTCNRVELYAICQDVTQGRRDILQVLSETRHIDLAELEAYCYSFSDREAVSHLFGVSSGLYSLVPGEPQIQGQVVDALEIAQGSGFAGPFTSALFRACDGCRETCTKRDQYQPQRGLIEPCGCTARASLVSRFSSGACVADWLREDERAGRS